MSKADDARLKQIRERFKLGVDADANQSLREREALRMFALDQWPESIQKARAAQAGDNGMPATPARPMLVVDKLREPVNQVVNQERESDLSVSLVAADDFGGLAPPVDPSEIELREGLIRRIQRESESASARSWAFLRAAICGRGFYGVNTRYAPGKTMDQEIYYRRFYDQTAVVLDPAHEEPDGSDAEWGFCFTVLSHNKYKAEYPRAKDAPNACVDSDDADWRRLGDLAPGWFTFEGEDRYVRVAEHWYAEYESRTLCHMPDGTIAWQDELPEDAPKPRATRSVAEKKVKWCKLDGCQILDETDWPSPFIPIIKVVGNEIPPCDGERRVDGMVNKSAIESQRGINYMASKLTEEVGLSAVTPLMVVEGTIEGYEEWYKQANTRAFPYLPYKPTDLEGKPATAPFRPDKTPQIGPIATGLQMFVESVQSSTGVPNPNMGKADRNSPTWRGTQALLAQGQRGSSNYMDNLARSVRYDGRITNSLLYPIMGIRPGRIARIVKGETETESVMIGQPFMMQANGQGQQSPVPAPMGATPQDAGVRQYTLTPNGDTMNVAVKVGKGFDTRRDEEAAMFGELLTQNPQLMAVVGDLFFGAQDWPGAKQAAERFKVMLDPKVLAQIQQKDGGQPAIPPQVQQQMQMMQQQLQQVTQAAQGMQQELQTKSYQVQSDERIAMEKVQSDERMAMAKLETEKLIAAAKIDAESRRELERQVAERDREQLKARNTLTEIAMQAELDAVAQPMMGTETSE